MLNAYGRMFSLIMTFGVMPPSPICAQDFQLQEQFPEGHTSKVEVRVKISGKLSVPSTEKGKPAQLVPLVGTSHGIYDERLLPPDDTDLIKTIRIYRTFELERTLGTVKQEASLRPSVRRLVIIKSGERKAPFSPDGPLTWGEIDLIRAEVLNPALIPGLLPSQPVRVGASWKVSAAAVQELTDMEKIDEGDMTVEFVGLARPAGQSLARLRLRGSVRGVNEDGPNRQQFDGTAYFDLQLQMLTYLSLKGTKELLDGRGETVGIVEGHFTMTRSPLEKKPAELSEASLRDLDLKPGPENTLLLYDNPDLGLRLLHPRGWRIGAVQGRQVTLDHARGAGLLLTVEPASQVPTAEDYLKEVTDYFEKQKATITVLEKPTRIRASPITLDRFAIEATVGKNPVRIEYAVLKQTDGGITVAATLPTDAKELRAEVDRIVRSLSVTKKIVAPAEPPK
ncbi:MAG: hypothetical protein RMJ56_15210 [Gemmataceae bacterium]|nr:hypothetical protein [Gemmata sp.]MDW8198945.1 hypothetical protein [Gemmataceae bacterium]